MSHCRLFHVPRSTADSPMHGRLSQRRRYCQEGSAHLCGRSRGTAVALAAPDETESARDPQRVRDRYRPRRRPAGRRTRGHGTADPAGRPGGRVPPPGARRTRPALRKYRWLQESPEASWALYKPMRRHI